jgi:hypothetical protein
MNAGRVVAAAIGMTVALAFAVGAWAHMATQEGGPGNNTLDGHDHSDRQLGRGGCDDLRGHGGSDEGFGGSDGCDRVRGQGGPADAAIVCDDGAGNDEAYGGSGGNDFCYGSLQDVFDLATCELPEVHPTHCTG